MDIRSGLARRKIALSKSVSLILWNMSENRNGDASQKRFSGDGNHGAAD